MSAALAPAAAPSSNAPYRPGWGAPTVLQQVLRRDLGAFVAEAERGERSLPDFVVKELSAIAHCGDPSRGLTRWRCPHCAHERLLVFRCKSSLCPTCAGRRMADKSELLLETLPRVPMRQWVATFPPQLRYLMAYDAGLTGALATAVVRAVFCWQRRRAKELLGLDSVQQAHGAAVTSVQRARSDLRSSVHVHTVTFDGVYVEAEPGTPPRFHALPAPAPDDLQHITADIVRRGERLLARRGLRWTLQGAGAEDSGDADDPVAIQEPLFAECCAHSMQGIVTMGARRGQHLATTGHTLRTPRDLRRAKPDVADAHGLNLHAGVRVAAHDRDGLRRLLRYILRPPIANERLSFTDDGRLRYRLKRAFDGGINAVYYEPLDLVAKLVPLVPRPRFNELRYHGLLAAAARLRPAVVTPRAPKPAAPRQLGLFARAPTRSKNHPDQRTRYSFAELMKRTLSIDVDTCPRCGGGPMRLVATVTDPAAIAALLAATAAAAHHTPPPTPRARPPPQLELAFA